MNDLSRSPLEKGDALRADIGLMTEQDVAALLDVKVETIVNWRYENQGPDYVKLGRAVFYRRQDIETWITLNVVPMKRTGTKG